MVVETAKQTTSDLEALRSLMQTYCLKQGDFTLSSGLPSKYYYDGKRGSLDAHARRLIGRSAVGVVLESGAEAVGGPEIGAIPIALAIEDAALDCNHNLRAFIVRKAQKEHGTRDRIAEAYIGSREQVLVPGTAVAIVDDVITTGGSIEQAINVVEELGCRVALVLALVERHERGADSLRERGYDVLTLFRTDQEGQLLVDEQFLRRSRAAPQARVLPR